MSLKTRQPRKQRSIPRTQVVTIVLVAVGVSHGSGCTNDTDVERIGIAKSAISTAVDSGSTTNSVAATLDGDEPLYFVAYEEEGDSPSGTVISISRGNPTASQSWQKETTEDWSATTTASDGNEIDWFESDPLLFGFPYANTEDAELTRQDLVLVGIAGSAENGATDVFAAIHRGATDEWSEAALLTVEPSNQAGTASGVTRWRVSKLAASCLHTATMAGGTVGIPWAVIPSHYPYCVAVWHQDGLSETGSVLESQWIYRFFTVETSGGLEVIPNDDPHRIPTSQMAASSGRPAVWLGHVPHSDNGGQDWAITNAVLVAFPSHNNDTGSCPSTSLTTGEYRILQLRQYPSVSSSGEVQDAYPPAPVSSPFGFSAKRCPGPGWGTGSGYSAHIRTKVTPAMVVENKDIYCDGGTCTAGSVTFYMPSAQTETSPFGSPIGQEQRIIKRFAGFHPVDSAGNLTGLTTSSWHTPAGAWVQDYEIHDQWGQEAAVKFSHSNAAIHFGLAFFDTVDDNTGSNTNDQAKYRVKTSTFPWPPPGAGGATGADLSDQAGSGWLPIGAAGAYNGIAPYVEHVGDGFCGSWADHRGENVDVWWGE